MIDHVADPLVAALALVECLRTHGVTRVLVVGGGDDSRAGLDHLLTHWGIELRSVDATKGSHAQKDADSNMAWCDVLVVWGGTQLPHKVSNLYRHPPARVRAVNPNRRGVESLCHAVIESFAGRDAPAVEKPTDPIGTPG